MQELKVSKREAGQRLDKYLRRFLNQAPDSFIYKMLRKKNITLNEKKASGSEKLVEDDNIKLFLSDDTIAKFSEAIDVANNLTLDIIFEDEDVVFINKPAGVLSQKASVDDVSMNEYLISYLVENQAISMRELATFHPAICNRLDRNTSGLLLAGKSMAGLQGLSDMLKQRTMRKFYMCLVKGVVEKGNHIKGYLKKDEQKNKVRISEDEIKNGEQIETAYEPLGNNGEITLLKVELITGKTHQIRSHLNAIGHPLVGDHKYGDKKVNEAFKTKYKLHHHLLHSWFIEFGEIKGDLKGLSKRKFIAPAPPIFEEILKAEHLEEHNE